MVNFNGTYIDGSAILLICPYDTGDKDYPYGLSVELTTGARYAVRYNNRTNRENAKYDLIKGIDRDRRENTEYLLNKTISIESTVNRLEKRQLRIQKLLKEVLKWDDKKDG